MFKRILIVGGLGITGFIGLAGAADVAGAQTNDPRCYPVVTSDCPADVTISDTTVTTGESVTATGTGLDPGTPATGTANSTPLALGTKTVDAAGTVSFTFTVPADFENGAHSVVIQGVKNGAPTTLTVNFTVSGAQGATTTTTRAGSGTIPRTGDDSTVPMTSVAIGLLAAGSGVVYLAKRRRAAAAA